MNSKTYFCALVRDWDTSLFKNSVMIDITRGSDLLNCCTAEVSSIIIFIAITTLNEREKVPFHKHLLNTQAGVINNF